MPTYKGWMRPAPDGDWMIYVTVTNSLHAYAYNRCLELLRRERPKHCGGVGWWSQMVLEEGAAPPMKKRRQLD